MKIKRSCFVSRLLRELKEEALRVPAVRKEYLRISIPKEHFNVTKRRNNVTVTHLPSMVMTVDRNKTLATDTLLDILSDDTYLDITKQYIDL